jgi:hypothetical protein
MPLYELLDLASKKQLSVVFTSVEYEKCEIACPKCGSTQVDQHWTAYCAVGSNKS